MTIRMGLLKSISGVALLLVATLPVRADDASKRAKIEQLLILTRQQETIEQSVAISTAEVERRFPAMFPELKMNTLQKQDHDALMRKVVEIMRDSSGWRVVHSKYVEAYAATYSEATIEGMLAFYDSSVGRDVIAKRPLLTENLAGAKRAILQDALPKIRSAFEAYLRAKGPGNAITPAHEPQ